MTAGFYRRRVTNLYPCTRQIDIEQLCADKGLRITEQRRTIARVLSEAEDHPDVETPPRARRRGRSASISIATVYRTVRLFEEAGILERHEFGDGRSRLRSRVGRSSRPSDRCRDRHGDRIRRRGARDAPAAHRRKTRLSPRRSSHGALWRRDRSRTADEPSSRWRAYVRIARLALLFLICLPPHLVAPARRSRLAVAAPLPDPCDAHRRRAGRARRAPARPAQPGGRQPYQLARHPHPWGRDGHALRVEGRSPARPADRLAGGPESHAVHRARRARRRAWPGRADRRRAGHAAAAGGVSRRHDRQWPRLARVPLDLAPRGRPASARHKRPPGRARTIATRSMRWRGTAASRGSPMPCACSG